MSSNKVIFEQPGGNTGVNHDHPTAALHITQEHGHETQPILKLESPDPTISFIDSTDSGLNLHMYWNGGAAPSLRWFLSDKDSPLMVLSKEGVLGVGVHSFTGVQDGSPSVLSDIIEPKIYTDGSIQITNGTGAFVVGTGSGSFLRDEELGFGWGGGWYMTDNTYLRVRNDKHVYSAGGATFTGVTSNSNIQINSTTPVLVMKDTNATSAQTHNSFISFKSSENTERAWMGFGGVTDNKFRIVNKWETPVHIHGSCSGAEPLSTLIVQDNSESNHAGILIAGHSNKQTHLRFQHGDDLMWQWRVPMHSSSNGDSMRLYSWTAGADVLTVDNGGNVGIGTTIPRTRLQVAYSEGDVSPGVNFQEVVRARGDWNTKGSGPAITFTNYHSSANNENPSPDEYNLAAIQGCDFNGKWSGGLKFFVTSDHDQGGAVGGSGLKHAMSILPNRNVGIGTDTPGSSLHVAGSIGTTPVGDGVHMGVYAAGSYSYGNIQLQAPSGGYIDFSKSGTDWLGRILYNAIDNYMRFDTNSAERMRIDGNGRVGIGTDTPIYKLNLEESNPNTPCYLGITGGSQHAAGVLFGDVDNKSIGRLTYNNTTNSMTFRTAGSDWMTIDSVGDVYMNRSVRSSKQVRAAGWFTGDTEGHGSAVEIGISGGMGYLMNFNREMATYGTIIVQSNHGRARFDDDGLIRIGHHSDGTKQLHMLGQTGLFGVGKTPSYKLDVAGDINLSGKLMKNGSEQTLADKSDFVRKTGLGSANYYSADNWIEFWNTNNGLHWNGSQTGAGWHIYPGHQSDMRFRSGGDSVALRLETSDLNIRGYAYANNDNDIGFLNKNRHWRLRMKGLQANTTSTAGNPNLYFDNDVAKWTGEVVGNSCKLEYHNAALYFAVSNSSSTSPTQQNGWIFRNGGTNVAMMTRAGELKLSSNLHTVWHAGNDGASSGLDADKLDGQHLDYFARKQHFRSVGAPAYTSSTTTAGLVSELHNEGMFQSYLGASKASWSYGSNNNLTDAGRFKEIAGTSFLTWTDNTSSTYPGNITIMAICPNTGDSAGKMFVYNDQGSGYSPGWREIWTSRSDGSGSGLDADLLDGLHASSFVKTTYNSSLNTDTRNSRGVTRLYRRDSNSDYSVQTEWTGNHWYLKGYGASDGFHAHCRVGYADSAADASKLDGVDSSQFLRSDVSDTFSADLNSSGTARLVLKKTNNNLADHICFHNGSTRVGEIGCLDNSWLRINQHTASNIYTPRIIRADGGFNVDNITVVDGNANIIGERVTGTVANADKLDDLHASSFLRSGSSTQAIRGGQIYASDWFRNTGSATGLYNTVNDAHFYSAGNNYWHINGNSGDHTSGGLVFYDRFNSSQGNATGRKGYVYWASDGFGLLDNDGAWAVKTQLGNNPLQLSCNGNVELEVHTTYVQANGSFRAPHFYVDGNMYHNGDSNTYVGFHANDQFRVVCAGSEQMEWGSGYTLLNDNKTLRFGSSSDFRQWFDGSNMYFRNYYHSSGNIYFQGEDPSGSNKALLYMHNDVSGGSYLRLFYNGGDRMRTSATGIDVYGGTGTEGGQINLKYNSGHANHVSIDVIRNTGQYDGSTSDWYWRVFNDTISPVYQMLFNTKTGDFEVSGDVISFGDSDLKLKSDLQLIQNPVDKIKQLNGYTFTWNDESTKSGKHDIGVVAQEVEAVFPELVKTKLTGHKGVSYEKLTAVLIAGVNQQQEQIEQQQRQIDQLSEQIKQLIDRIEK